MKTKIKKWLPLMAITAAIYLTYYAMYMLSNPEVLAWWQRAHLVWRGGW